MKYFFTVLILTGLHVSGAAQQKPLKLWYDRPAEHFEEALVLGNGKTGATVFGGVVSDKILLNDITLWSGEPVNPDMNPQAHTFFPLVRAALKKEDYRAADSLIRNIQGKFSESFAPLGTLYIDFEDKSDLKKYYRELSLDNALATVIHQTGDNTVTREYLVSHPDKVLAIRIRSEKPVSFTIRQNSLLRYKTRVENGILNLSGRAPVRALPVYYNPAGLKAIEYDEQRGTAFTSQVRVITGNGTAVSSDSTIGACQTTEALILVAVATSFNGFDKDPAKNGRDEQALAAEYLNQAAKKTFAQLKATHLKDYQPYFSRVKLDLQPDPAADIPTDERLKKYMAGAADRYLETLYFQFGRYLLIASSRTPGVPANLQGLWNPHIRPPWSSNYTTNINLEENYWLAENTNLPEMHRSLLTFAGNIAQTGAITARSFYGARGWSMAHNSDIWAMTNPVGDFGHGDPVWANWAMGGTWVATHLWEHYQFSRDVAWLKTYAFPLMKGAAEFCLDMLVEGPDGHLVTSPSTSPENKFITPDGYRGATLYGAAADLGMIRELFSQVIAAAEILKTDEPLTSEVKTALARLRPYQVGRKGNLQEWYYDWADQEVRHRHQSHLFGLYPGSHITVKNTPELAQAARTTLEIKGDETTGWSKGWRINLWARLLDGNRAYKMYRELLKYVEPDAIRPKNQNHGGTYPNLMDAHPPFQIDGNFGGAAAVAEMLLQSGPEEINLLPALPDAWPSGTVSGLRARGGFELDLTWKNGQPEKVTVYGKPGGSTRLIYKDQVREIRVKKGEKQVISFR
ncbi:MAG: glycoside hydrolase family 95 protein [Leadbetterella sp.]|nr:glycoside hydrolase family 95 protein [Leadbetterella sp.]